MEMGGALSSFAISIAANIVTSLFARNDTEKEIRKAFQEAIEMWCPNEDIRRFKEKDIYKFVNGYIVNPAIDSRELPEELKSFLDCFEKCIANHHSAALYLSAIKEKDYYDIAMASLNLVHTKLDSISRKLDVANPRHEELHFEAVAEINTILHDVVEEPINVFFYGILSAFKEDIFAYTKENDDGIIEVLIDDESKLMYDEDHEKYRPKLCNINYDWDKEIRQDWTQINTFLDSWQMFEDNFIAAFQLMRIDFFEGIEELQECVDRKSINDQLSTEEKRQLTEIIADMRALQAVFEDHHNIFCLVDDCHFKNLETKLLRSFEDHGEIIGDFQIIYNDGHYSEVVTETFAPIDSESTLLKVMKLNPDYYYKLTGYMGVLINNVVAWWKMTCECRDDA